jgi:hypothetical protein
LTLDDKTVHTVDSNTLLMTGRGPLGTPTTGTPLIKRQVTKLDNNNNSITLM